MPLDQPWLPAWFRPPTWSGLGTGHHVRPLRSSDDLGGRAHPRPDDGLRYVVLDDEERQVLGWIDLRPGPDAAHDAVVTWDLAGHLAGSAVEAALDRQVADWVRHEWPFTAPRSGRRAGRAGPPRRG